MASNKDVTKWLVAWNRGDEQADSRLISAVYDDLRRVARRRLGAERAGHSLAPTALVHEAYLRLVDMRDLQWQNRAHFFAVAARLMRQILVDHARTQHAEKRGGAAWKVPLSEDAAVTAPREAQLLDLDAALVRLEAHDSTMSDLVVLRFFGGLTIEEAAQELDLSEATVKRSWARARAWLFRELWPEAVTARGAARSRDAEDLR
jgi:RNA polymerase sigma factor (TIGR02999 family)